MSQPISVIIPCHNGEKYIRESLESVKKQNWDFEVILVDDGSVDDTAQIVKNEYPDVRYHYQEKSSPACARNTGIQLATHEIIAFLDADDVWEDEKTKLQMRVFDQNPKTAVVGGLIRYWVQDESEYRSAHYPKGPIEHVLLSAILVKKSVFDSIGNLDESLPLGEDLDWFLRLKESEHLYTIIDKLVLNYRIHEKGITSGKSAIGMGTTEAIKKALDRRRMG